MTLRATLHKVAGNGWLNFICTNHIPRSLLTRLVGRISKSERPWVRDVSMGVWKLFSDLDLSDSKEQRFASMHACFTRQLKEGARPIDTREEMLVSPCDGLIGACGAIDDSTLVQAKGLTYSLEELLCDTQLADKYRNGVFVTLRLTSTMYHRFHAPGDGTVTRVNYVSGDVWNVNPPALQRVAKLFCKNERAIIPIRLAPDRQDLLLVPVAAVLVASIRLHFLNALLHLKYRGPNEIPCQAKFKKGDELGWFEHGSNIIAIAPQGFRLTPNVRPGERIRVGEVLLQVPPIPASDKLPVE